MKKNSILPIVALLIATLFACNQQEGAISVPQSTPNNNLISDLPLRGVEGNHRSYNLYPLIAPLSDSGYQKAASNTNLDELYRFIYRGSIDHFSSTFFLFDMRSNRIYYSSQGVIDNVLTAEQIVEISETDISLIKNAIQNAGVQSWQSSYPHSGGNSWDVVLQFNNGSVEQHTGPGIPQGMDILLNYIVNQTTSYPARIREQHKTTSNIDYLITTYGNRYEMVPSSTINFSSPNTIDRILVFQAQGPHTVLDHSRQPQKTLLLDVKNNTMYFDSQHTIYENITLAETTSSLNKNLLSQMVALLEEYDVKHWSQEVPYIGNTEQRIMNYGDIPAWSIAIQFSDGRILHYLGDGLNTSGYAPGCQELLNQIWSLPV